MTNLLLSLELNSKAYGGKKSPQDIQRVIQCYSQQITFNSTEYFIEEKSAAESKSQQQDSSVSFSESRDIPTQMWFSFFSSIGFHAFQAFKFNICRSLTFKCESKQDTYLRECLHL